MVEGPVLGEGKKKLFWNCEQEQFFFFSDSVALSAIGVKEEGSPPWSLGRTTPAVASPHSV